MKKNLNRPPLEAAPQCNQVCERVRAPFCTKTRQGMKEEWAGRGTNMSAPAKRSTNRCPAQSTQRLDQPGQLLRPDQPLSADLIVKSVLPEDLVFVRDVR